ncbi:HNH endonuclease [Propionicimonas paludicola]|uniref:HNH endonuclease n=1 Tax=Propionicimonas paludicola TaxID=185243 RepID=A0A2A9CSD2_9ACTN|nr:HNH endonuclease signature motif containing protein [Propionicimonas paludicola]PFG17343.1 HNH endonuclease [Propionicimonas paludicola]
MAAPVRRTRRARAARRRSLRLAGRDNDLTSEQWRALQEAWGGCAYCGAPGTSLQRDCLQPVAHGGRYTLTNVVPACPTCNASKSDTEVTGWLRRKRLDEAAFLLRQREVSAALATRFAAVSDPSPAG